MPRKSGISPVFRYVAIATALSCPASAQTANSQANAWVLTPSSLLSVNLQSGAVEKRFPAGPSPDFAVSPAANRVFIASNSIATFDATSGTALSTVPNPHAPIWPGHTPGSLMAAADDGSRLYMVKRQTQGGADITSLTSFDVASQTFDPFTLSLGNDCAGAAISLRSPQRLDIVCGGKNVIYAVTLGAEGRLKSETTLTLPPPPPLLPTGQRHAPGDIRMTIWGAGNAVYLVSVDGRVTHADTQTMSVVAKSAQPLDDHLVLSGDGAISRDQRTLFVGCSERGDWSGLKNFIAVFDASTLQRIKTVPVPYRFEDVVWSPSTGELILTVPGSRPELVALDPDTLRESRIMPLPDSPAFLRY